MCETLVGNISSTLAHVSSLAKKQLGVKYPYKDVTIQIAQ
jgi:hypothetical protein